MSIQTALGKLAAGAVLVAAFGGSLTPALADKASDTLTVALDMEVETMNPYQSTSRMSLIASKMMFDTLVWRDPETGEHMPMLATAWEWLDPTTLEMTLREGVVFQNGEPFDAEDAAWTLNFFSSPEGRTKGMSSVNWIDHAEIVDPTKIRIHLKAPFPAALEFLSGPIVILPKDHFEAVGFDGFEKDPGRHRPLQGGRERPRRDDRLRSQRGLLHRAGRGRPRRSARSSSARFPTSIPSSPS